MSNFRILKVVKVIVLIAVAVSFFTYLVMYLWNWLLPDILGVAKITFIQAMGILVLSRLLFGNFSKGHHHHHGGSWKHKLKERYKNLSEEEKNKFRERFGRYCNSYQCQEEEESKSESTGDNT